ncbi:MAG: AAA family ATPase [Candidatus Hydrothermarchaeales archaeon]
MIIEEVKIKNFRSHSLTELEFDEGITVIIGDNGSGKTSILDAINFALFKQRPEKVNMDDMIRRGSEEAKVTVIFHANGRSFKVVRGRRPKKPWGSALYEVNGSKEILIAEGEDEITDEIKKISNLNGEIFTSAIYIRQGEIDKLLSATPSARKVHIGKLLGTEDLENAHRHMRDLIDIYKIKIGGMQNVYDDIKKVKGAIEKERSAILELKGELSGVAEKLKKKSQFFEETEQKIELLEFLKDLENDVEKNQALKDRLSEKIEELTRYEKILKETKDAHKSYIKIENDIERVKEKRSGLLKYLERDARLKEDLDFDNKKLKEVNSFISNVLGKTSKIFKRKIEAFEELEKLTLEGIKKIKTELKEHLKEKEKLTSKIGKLEGKNEEIKRSVEELETAKDQCPVCNARLTPEHKAKLLADYSEKLKKNRDHILALKEKLRVYSKDESDLEEFMKRLENINLEVIKSKFDTRSEIEKEIKKRETEIEKNRKYIEESELLEKELEKKEVRREKLKEDNELYIGAKQFLRKNRPEKENIKLKIKKLEKKIENRQDKIESVIEKIGYKMDSTLELERLKKERGQLLNKVTKLEKAKSGGESVVTEKREHIKNLKSDQKELKEKREELKKLTEFNSFLGKIRRFFHKDVLQKELRMRSKPLVESYTREVFDRFDLPYSDIALTNDFDLMVYGPLGKRAHRCLAEGKR